MSIPGVVRAANDLQANIVRIPGGHQSSNEPPAGIAAVIMVGTLDGCYIVKGLIAATSVGQNSLAYNTELRLNARRFGQP